MNAKRVFKEKRKEKTGLIAIAYYANVVGNKNRSMWCANFAENYVRFTLAMFRLEDSNEISI